MLPLPTSFKDDGFTFTLIRREGDIALLSKTKPHYTRPSFEVVRIVHRPAEMIKGKPYPAREALPSTSTWGTYGWTYCTLEDALVRFNKLQQCPPGIEGAAQDEPEATGP
jgi:hypothetical protein